MLLGVVCAAAACRIVSWAEMTVGTIQLGICQFTPVALGLLLIIVALNLVLGRLAPRIALGPHEVIVIYTMTLAAALTMSRGLLERWIPALVAINYYADPANNWQSLFFRHIPRWAVPFDVEGDARARRAPSRGPAHARSLRDGCSRPGCPRCWRCSPTSVSRPSAAAVITEAASR